ncbi:hypothetical protein Tco_0087741, partial [Tanacetum coccineum]
MLLRPQHAGFGKPKTVVNPQQKEYKMASIAGLFFVILLSSALSRQLILLAGLLILLVAIVKENALVFIREMVFEMVFELRRLSQQMVKTSWLEAIAASPAVESFVNSSEMLENQEYNRSKGYHAVPPPYTGNFIPRKPDLTFIDEIVECENMDVTTVITPSDFEKDMSNNES